MGLLLLLGGSQAWAQVYKWTDEQGKVHFSDQPSARHASKAVSAGVKSVGEVSTEDSAVDTGGDVVMYATSWCGYCRQAREYFRAKGIEYTEYDIETNRIANMEHKDLGGRGVPLILVGKKRMSGFSPAGFEAIYR